MPKKILKSTVLVSSMTLVSRVFGFARDVILAQVFGAGFEFDAFVVAFKIPNFLRRLFAEGAFTQAFLPILAEKRRTRSREELEVFLGQVAGTLIVAVLAVVILSELFAPGIVSLFAPGFLKSMHRFHLATMLLRIVFPYLMLITLVAFMTAVLNTFYQFGIPAFTPVLLNLALIVAALFVTPYTGKPIYVLAWAVLAGGALQCALQVVPIFKLGLRIKPIWGWRDSAVRGVVKRMVPALFGVSVAQMGLLIDNVFASFLPVGSISWLYYSDRLIFFPLGVIGVALATVVMPHLSEQHASPEKGGFAAILDWSVRSALLAGLPAAVGLAMLAGPLVATLIYHGAFDVNAVWMTQKSLMAFSLGLPAFMLIKVLASAFYSRQNIRTPVIIAAVALLINIGLNFLLIGPLKHAGLALASSLAAYVNAGLLVYRLWRDEVYHGVSGAWVFYGRLVLASVAMCAFLFYGTNPLPTWLSWSLSERIVHLGGLVLGGMVIYGLVLWILGFRMRDIKAPS